MNTSNEWDKISKLYLATEEEKQQGMGTPYAVYQTENGPFAIKHSMQNKLDMSFASGYPKIGMILYVIETPES